MVGRSVSLSLYLLICVFSGLIIPLACNVAVCCHCWGYWPVLAGQSSQVLFGTVIIIVIKSQSCWWDCEGLYLILSALDADDGAAASKEPENNPRVRQKDSERKGETRTRTRNVYKFANMALAYYGINLRHLVVRNT